MSCTITKSGTILETETDIAVNELPVKAINYLNQHYKNVEAKRASKIVETNGKVNCEANVNKKDVIFDANGNLFKVEND